MDFDFYDYDNFDFDYFPPNQPEQQTSPFIQTTTKQMIDSFDEIVFGNRDSVSIKNLGDIIRYKYSGVKKIVNDIDLNCLLKGIRIKFNESEINIKLNHDVHIKN